jgi:hypothetical protein
LFSKTGEIVVVAIVLLHAKKWQVGGFAAGDQALQKNWKSPTWNWLPCARITSIRFKGTFSVNTLLR